MDPRRQLFVSFMNTLEETLDGITEEIKETEPLRTLILYKPTFGDRYTEWPFRCSFESIVSSNFDFEVKISGFYTYEEAILTLDFETPWGAKVTEGLPPTISFNGVKWNCTNVIPDVSKVVMTQQFQLTDCVIDRAALTELFTKIRVLYDHQRSVHLDHKANGLYKGNEDKHFLMLVGSLPHAENQSLFKGVSVDCLRIMARYMLDSSTSCRISQR